jgi:hypothetical protein
MHKIVDMIRTKEPDTPVVLAYEDQPQVRHESLLRSVSNELCSHTSLVGISHQDDSCSSSELCV